MKKKYSRGDYGYLHKQKKLQLFMAVLLFSVAIIMFVGGYFMNGRSKANIFTILAALTMLPAAKYFVIYIILFPFKSIEQEKYEKVYRLMTEDLHLFTDLVITSPQKVMNLSFLLVGKGQVIGLIGKAGQDVPYMKEYLSKGTSNWTDDYQVKLYTDYKKFINEISNLNDNEVNEKEETELIAYFTSLIV